MKILFMGTPSFSVASLKRLVEDGHEICGVFTQPDKPKNRGMKLTFSPVKEYALSQNLSVYQPRSMRDDEAIAQVAELAPDLIVVAAYGKILPESVLNTPQLGSINVHSSILPKYRGAAPINWAILNGETETGVTIMYMAKALDAGDIIRIDKTPIDPDETAESLTERLAQLGADTLSTVIPQLANGTAQRIPQNDADSTYASMLSKTLSPIDWTKDSLSIHNQVRGLIPWPCASTILEGKRFKIYKTVLGSATDAEPGTILSAGNDGIEIACGDDMSLFIVELQAEGKKRMAAADYLRGHPIHV